jgi:hypothetical protein
MKAVVFALVFVCSLLLASATVPVPEHLLKEWSQFNADEKFYDQVDSFLEESSKASGDFQFKCETTCQLVQKSTGAPAAQATLLQTEEGVSQKQSIENAFYKNVDSFLQTEQSSGGDFEFKCETTCQLVQSDAAPATSAPATSTTSTPPHAAARAAAHNFLQTEAGLGTEARQQLQTEQKATAQTATSAQQTKDCYRLCLNPSMNPGCDAAASVVSLLQTGEMVEEELMRKNWSLGSGSGNCLNSCVHVCMAVHDSVRA